MSQPPASGDRRHRSGPGGRAATRRRAVTGLLLAVLLGLAGCTSTAAPPTAPLLSDRPPVPTPGPTPSDEPGYSQPTADPVYPDYGNPDLDVLSYQLVLGWEPTTRVLT